VIVANFMDSSLKDLEKKGVLSGVGEIYNPDKAYKKVIHFTPHGRDLELAEVLSRDNISIVCHQASAFSPIKIIKAIQQASSIFKKEKVDIVRGRLPYVGSLIAGIAARRRRLPFVVSLGGDNRIVQERNRAYYYNYRFLSYGIETLVLRMADAVIVPNRFTHDYVASIIGQRAAYRKCVTIPWISSPITEEDPDAPAIDHLVSPDAAVVPVIGFLNKYKFSDVLFDALDGIPEKSYDGRRLQFVFCGDGPLRKDGEERFRDKGNVRFLGWQQRPLVHALLRRAAFVLIPMSGFVLLEAASIGKPVITSAMEWHPELVRNGETGLLVDPYDPSSWRKAISICTSDPLRTRAMGQKLRAQYEADYSRERSIDAEVSLYERLTDKPVASTSALRLA
jgi:glycosyltransferase involved in cell wall biosynthesis